MYANANVCFHIRRSRASGERRTQTCLGSQTHARRDLTADRGLLTLTLLTLTVLTLTLLTLTLLIDTCLPVVSTDYGLT